MLIVFFWPVPIQSSDLNWAMFSALVGNKPQFVRLLLENGASLRDFLQGEETLCMLYRQLPGCFFLRKLAKRVHSSCRSRRPAIGIRARAHSGELISLTHVSDEVRHLLGSFTKPIYPPPATANNFSMSMEDSSTSVSLSLHIDTILWFLSVLIPVFKKKTRSTICRTKWGHRRQYFTSTMAQLCSI